MGDGVLSASMHKNTTIELFQNNKLTTAYESPAIVTQSLHSECVTSHYKSTKTLKIVTHFPKFLTFFACKSKFFFSVGIKWTKNYYTVTPLQASNVLRCQWNIFVSFSLFLFCFLLLLFKGLVFLSVLLYFFFIFSFVSFSKVYDVQNAANTHAQITLSI